MPAAKSILRPAIWIAYAAIGLEFLFMISPFAFFFYSSYGPALNLLHRSSATAWLTSFYLPHFSKTSSPPLEVLKPVGFGLVLFGLVVFLVGVVQIYGTKLLRRGAVTGGLYRLSRHPQYTALILLGLGLILVWPRYLVLLAYVTMLFLYVALARWEERACLEKYGDTYREYCDRTGRFFPRLRSKAVASAGQESATHPFVTVAAYIAALVLATGMGLMLERYSLARVSAVYEPGAAVLSPAVIDTSELRRAYEVARREPEVANRLAQENANLAIYVVPADWYLADLPLEAWEEVPPEHRRGHVTPADFDRSRYKVLFTRVLSHRPGVIGPAILRTAYGREPLLRVRVDLAEGRIEAIESPPDNVVWGDIPTPMF